MGAITVANNRKWRLFISELPSLSGEPRMFDNLSRAHRMIGAPQYEAAVNGCDQQPRYRGGDVLIEWLQRPMRQPHNDRDKKRSYGARVTVTGVHDYFPSGTASGPKGPGTSLKVEHVKSRGPAQSPSALLTGPINPDMIAPAATAPATYLIAILVPATIAEDGSSEIGMLMLSGTGGGAGAALRA